MNKSLTFILLLTIMFVGCSEEAKVKNLDSRGTAIICLGDSLTEGVGAEPGRDYPSILSEYLGRKVINAGVSGDTTGDALKRIKRDVLEQDPKMVIVLLGGNDFLQKIPMEKTFQDLEKIVDLIQQRGAAVVLVEVKTSLWGDPYLAGFKNLAKQKEALLISDIFRGFIVRPYLMSDRYHPNAKGYAIFAKRIYGGIKPYLH